MYDETSYIDDDVIALYPADGPYMLTHFLQNAGDKTEIILKNYYTNLVYIMVVYQPE